MILKMILPNVELQLLINTKIVSACSRILILVICQAYESISDGLGKSASALVRTPLKRYQRGDGMGAALATVVQSTPVAAVAPVSAAARAMRCALLGVRNR